MPTISQTATLIYLILNWVRRGSVLVIGSLFYFIIWAVIQNRFTEGGLLTYYRLQKAVFRFVI